MTRPDLIHYISAAVADLVTALPEGLTDSDAAELIAAHMDRALTWEAAPDEWRPALEALDGPTLRLLVLGALAVGRRLPAALDAAQERVEARRERRAERRRDRDHV